MGAETVTLSFRMGGWILYTRTTLIPGLILLLIWCSDNGRLKKYFILGIILFLIHGITESLLTSSRGFVLILILDLAVPAYSHRQIKQTAIEFCRNSNGNYTYALASCFFLQIYKDAGLQSTNNHLSS